MSTAVPASIKLDEVTQRWCWVSNPADLRNFGLGYGPGGRDLEGEGVGMAL
jgi:hypothetical protein